MDKRILKQIAKVWAKSILDSTQLSAFDEDANGIFTFEEESYIMEELKKIGERITSEDVCGSLVQIIDKYYDFE